MLQTVLSTLRAFRRDRRAVTAIEYALIGAFVFLVIIVSLTQIGTALVVPFDQLGSVLH